MIQRKLKGSIRAYGKTYSYIFAPVGKSVENKLTLVEIKTNKKGKYLFNKDGQFQLEKPVKLDGIYCRLNERQIREFIQNWILKNEKPVTRIQFETFEEKQLAKAKLQEEKRTEDQKEYDDKLIQKAKADLYDELKLSGQLKEAATPPAKDGAEPKTKKDGNSA